MTVGWGVIGTGNHAGSRMAPAIGRAEGARLVAVQSRDLSRAQVFAEKHGAARAVDSIEALLGDPEVEVVYVGSPNGLHAEHTVAAARAGKHVFCDKPMATSAADCQLMIDACRKAGVQLMIGFNQRFQPAHRWIREVVQRGTIGTVVMIKIEVAASLPFRLKDWWYDPELAGAGGLMATGTHAIDLARWITGADYASVAAMSDATDEKKGVDDVAAATMRLSDATFVQLTCGRKLPFPVNNLVIHGELGRIVTTGTMIYDIGGRVELYRPDASETHEFRPPSQNYDLFTAEVEHLSRIVRDGGTPEGTGEDGLICTRIVEAIQESARTGRTIAVEGERLRFDGEPPNN